MSLVGRGFGSAFGDLADKVVWREIWKLDMRKIVSKKY